MCAPRATPLRSPPMAMPTQDWHGVQRHGTVLASPRAPPSHRLPARVAARALLLFRSKSESTWCPRVHDPGRDNMIALLNIPPWLDGGDRGIWSARMRVNTTVETGLWTCGVAHPPTRPRATDGGIRDGMLSPLSGYSGTAELTLPSQKSASGRRFRRFSQCQSQLFSVARGGCRCSPQSPF